MKVGAFEAKTKLSAPLDRVERGEEVTITRHGKPGARLVLANAGHERARRHSAAVDKLLVLREKLKGSGITKEEIRSWIEEGRR